MLSWLTFHLQSDLVKSTLLICFGLVALFFMLGGLFLGKVHHAILDAESDWTLWLPLHGLSVYWNLTAVKRCVTASTAGVNPGSVPNSDFNMRSCSS